MEIHGVSILKPRKIAITDNVFKLYILWYIHKVCGLELHANPIIKSIVVY